MQFWLILRCHIRRSEVRNWGFIIQTELLVWFQAVQHTNLTFGELQFLRLVIPFNIVSFLLFVTFLVSITFIISVKALLESFKFFFIAVFDSVDRFVSKASQWSARFDFTVRSVQHRQPLWRGDTEQTRTRHERNQDLVKSQLQIYIFRILGSHYPNHLRKKSYPVQIVAVTINIPGEVHQALRKKRHRKHSIWKGCGVLMMTWSASRKSPVVFKKYAPIKVANGLGEDTEA